MAQPGLVPVSSVLDGGAMPLGCHGSTCQRDAFVG